MIEHSIQSMSLAETDDGEVVLPSEIKTINFPSNLRQFIILSRRAYNKDALVALECTEDIKIAYRDNEDVPPYFGLVLKFKPIHQTVEEFIDEEGDSFFDSLIQIVSSSSKRGISGKRAAFIREFRRLADPSLGEVMETKILISTNIFFNDYRVTVGYPSSEDEIEDVTGVIFEQILNQWDRQLKLEIDFVELTEYSDNF